MTTSPQDPGPGQAPQEAPHFTKEMLIDALGHLRGDLEASMTGEGADERARSRLQAARDMGLDRLAPEAIAIIDKARVDVRNLAWPAGLETRYMSLVSALAAMADASRSLTAPAPDRADLGALADVLARAERAVGSRVRRKSADRLRGLYVILDPAQTDGRDPAWVAEQAIAGGATAIQLRDKAHDKGDALPLARRLSELCAAAGVTLLINDHPDVAVAVGANGVHLGQHDLPLQEAQRVLRPWQVAGTSNALAGEARASYDQGADYIAVGRMFPTGSKSNTRPAGPETLREVRRLVPAGGPPVVAIGGITPENVGEVAAAGADGICVIASVTQADDPRAAAERLLNAFATAKQQAAP